MGKILFVINTMGNGGAERALIELLKHMEQERHKVFLYVLTGQGELAGEIPNNVVLLNKKYRAVSVLDERGRQRLSGTVIRALFSRGVFLHRVRYLAVQMLRMIGRGRIRKDKLFWKVLSDGGERFREEFDLAVAFLEGGSAYYVAAHVKAGKKVAFVHTDYSYAGYDRSLDEDCYLKFDHIFAASESIRGSFLGNYPECAGKTTIFHNLLNQKSILERSLQPGGFSDGYEGVRILTVARLSAAKAHDVAIDAMKRLKAAGREVRWYALGEGELRKKLERRIHSLGLDEDFVLLGAADNPFPYYAQCDLYVHHTHSEARCIAVREAQVLGCAIIVSDYEGSGELVEDGVDGRICRLDPKALTEEIEELLDHPERAAAYGRAAQRRHQTDNQKEIKKLLEFMDE